MANLWNYLFCIKGEDKTAEIVSWEFDNNKSVVYITYSNGKSYPYSIKNVLFLKNPKNIMISKQIVICKGYIKDNIKLVQFFRFILQTDL